MGHICTVDFIVITLYLLGMVVVGLWCARQQESLEEYFVAKRGVGSFVVGISMIATLLSTISYLTTPGEMIKNGPGMMCGMVHVPFSFIIVGYFVIPRIMRQKITSGYELLENRFGMGIRQTASILFLLVRLTWMGLIIYTCSLAVATMTYIPLYYVLAVVGIFATIYTVIGGIRAVIITDVVQFVILFGGGVLVILYVTYRCGGLSWWPDWSATQLAALQWKQVKIFSLNPFDRVTVINALIVTTMWWVCTATSDQVVIQRYLCTRNAREARRSFLHCLLGDAGIGVVLWVVGIALLGFFLRFPNELADTSKSVIDQADKLFPHFIGAILPAGVTGLLVAALFAAAMSSMDSGISSIGSVLLTDFKNTFAKGCDDNEQRLLKRAKLIGVVTGAVAISFSYGIEYVPAGNLFEIGSRITALFISPLFVLFALAFFVKFSTPAGAWSAIWVGFLSGVLFAYWEQIVGLFGRTEVFSFILIMPLSVLCSLVAGIAVSKFTKPRIAEGVSSQ